MIGAMPAVAVRHERQKQQKRSKWSSSLALQTPLTISGLTMIGAMPAVAVRHERRKQERRHKRPSQLGIQSPPGAGDSLDNVGLGALGSPDQLQSPLQRGGRQEYYVCGKVSVLHVVVVSLLLGAILVIVGLVQLTPNADASQHRYLLLGGGGSLLILGILLAVLRCCVLPWRERRLPGASTAGASATATAGNVHTGAAGGHEASGSGSGSGSVRDGTRSRTNSATNGQVARRASAFGVCTPTGGQRRRSLMELERGVATGVASGLTSGVTAGMGQQGQHGHHGHHGHHGQHPTLEDAANLEDAERRAEIDNHLNEMTVNAPIELAATFPVPLTPSPIPTPAEAPPPADLDTSDT